MFSVPSKRESWSPDDSVRIRQPSCNRVWVKM